MPIYDTEPTLITVMRLDHNSNKHVKSYMNCPLCGEEKLPAIVEQALRSRSGHYGYE